MSKKRTKQVVLLCVCILVLGCEPAHMSQEASKQSSPAVTHGMDVSNYQGDIDWEGVKKNEPKIVFVYIKATEGSREVDPRFERNWSGARAAEILRGAYHFFDAKDDAGAQADLFIKTVKSLEPGGLPPWLDLESGKFSAVDEVTKKQFIDGVFAWLDKVEKELGIKPVIYASPGFAQEHLTDERFGAYHLAVAEYNPQAAAPKMSGAWQGKTWTFWQYSSTGKVWGVTGEVDLDLYNGDESALKRLIKKRKR